ncbi:MAG: hypothetical protein SA339_07440 [Methanomassiliicoccus sp.]|nr:hypothetical protein [Methanomassiliicoccus sp.]
MKLPKANWLNIASKIGIVLGFVSIFLAWITIDFLNHSEIPLTRFIDPSNIWDLYQFWPYMLAPISGFFFLGGCILTIFTRWGAIAQIIGLITFASLYLMTYEGEQGSLGIGFYLGVLSAMICLLTGFALRGSLAPRSVKAEMR